MIKVLNINNEEEKRENPFKELAEIQRIKSSTQTKKPVFKIEFSWKLIALVLGIIAIVLWGKQILTLFVFLFLSVVIMSAVLPIVKWLQQRKIPKGWAIAITYFLGSILILALTALIAIPFINQLSKLGESIPIWIKSFTSGIHGFSIGSITIDSTVINSTILGWFEKLSSVDSFGNIATAVGGVFGWFSLFLAAVVFSVYLVIDHSKVLDLGLIRIISDEKRERVKKLVLDLESKLGKWLLGQAVVSTIAGTVLGSILAIFGIPFALPMGVFVALLSAIPSLGATVSSIPPLLIALIANGPLSAFLLLLIFLLYQQIENNFIIPKVMGNAAGVKPILVLFSAITFLILFGVWGAILSVPAIVISKICYEFYIDLQKIEAKGSIN